MEDYKEKAIYRQYNFWQRDSLHIELFTSAVFNQKLGYIHYNPVKAGICALAEEYYYSSALFYEKREDHFGFLEHYLGWLFYDRVGWSKDQASAFTVCWFQVTNWGGAVRLF